MKIALSRTTMMRHYPGLLRATLSAVAILGLIGWGLGIDPRVLISGAEIMFQSGQRQQQADAGRSASAGASSDEMGPIRGCHSWQYGSSVERDFCSRREDLQTANAGHVLWSNADWLWFCGRCDGAVLLPDRPKGLSRHKCLSAALASVRRRERVPAGSRRPM